MSVSTLQKLRVVVLLTMLSISLASCATPPIYWPEIKGVVLEAGTDKPLKAVFVTAWWTGQSGLAHIRTKCYRLQVTKTNEKGEFTMPGYLDGFSLLHRRNMGLFFHSRTHKELRNITTGNYAEQKKYYLEPITGTREERFDYLTKRGRGPTCDEGGKSIRSTYPIHKMVYEEAKALAKTPKEIKKLKWFRSRMASSIDKSYGNFSRKEREKKLMIL